MKNSTKKFVVLTVSIIIASCQEQYSNAPVAVSKAFNERYGEVPGLEWEQEGENEWEAEFMRGEIECSALFDAQGNLLETEVEIEIESLPENALKYIETHYSTHKITEAARIKDKQKGLMFFEAEVNEKDLIFDANGDFVREN